MFCLPHHAIIREDKQTTKTRIVFHASAKDSNGVSLNSCLEPGQALQPDLVGILLHFRTNYVGIMGDIETHIKKQQYHESYLIQKQFQIECIMTDMFSSGQIQLEILLKLPY